MGKCTCHRINFLKNAEIIIKWIGRDEPTSLYQVGQKETHRVLVSVDNSWTREAVGGDKSFPTSWGPSTCRDDGLTTERTTDHHTPGPHRHLGFSLSEVRSGNFMTKYQVMDIKVGT